MSSSRIPPSNQAGPGRLPSEAAQADETAAADVAVPPTGAAASSPATAQPLDPVPDSYDSASSTSADPKVAVARELSRRSTLLAESLHKHCGFPGVDENSATDRYLKFVAANTPNATFDSEADLENIAPRVADLIVVNTDCALPPAENVSIVDALPRLRAFASTCGYSDVEVATQDGKRVVHSKSEGTPRTWEIPEDETMTENQWLREYGRHINLHDSFGLTKVVPPLKLDTESDTFSVHNAHLGMRISQLSYLHPTKLRAGLAASGFDADTLRTVENEKTSAAAFVVNDMNGKTYVGMRGTDSVQDHLRNLEGEYVQPRWLKRKHPNANLHKGFNDAVDSIWDDLKDAIKANQTDESDAVMFAGHSLGGAIANVAAFRLNLEGDRDGSDLHIYSYGSPRIGDKRLARAMDQTIHNNYRVVRQEDGGTECDPVTRLPPRWIGFRHPGRLGLISGDGLDVASAATDALSIRAGADHDVPDEQAADDNPEPRELRGVERFFRTDLHVAKTYLSCLNDCALANI